MNKTERILSYPEAIREATELEMRRDDSVILFGQGVDGPKAILGTTKNLAKQFGSDRVFDTPLSEDAMTGFAVGTALAGLRPIHTHIRMDFVLLAMNQLINMAAKMHYMFGEEVYSPIVVRSMIGKSWGQGPQHSQSLYPLFMNIPGLKIVAPSTPYDAKGCLIQSIRDNNPVIYIEHRHLYYQNGHVPQDAYVVPFGKARVLKTGKDITLLGVSQMAVECLRAGRYLEDVGIDAEIIDPVSLSPLDMKTVLKSVKKTGHLIVVDNAWTTCGAGAEILAQIKESGESCDTRRLGFAFVTCPTTPSLEKYFYPDSKLISSEAHSMLLSDSENWIPDYELLQEEVAFKGPF